MKTVLLVPGFQEDLTTRDYDALITCIEHKGYKVTFVPIAWKRTVLDDWVVQLEAVYREYAPDDVVLAGFSYGSMTAFMAAVKRSPSELWLFSFSPYFSDDMPVMKKSWLKVIGKRRAERFRKLYFTDLVRRLDSGMKTKIWVGEIEAKKYPLIGRRSEIAHKAIRGSELIRVPGAGHDVAHGNYLRAIEGNI